jgi:sugar phosphate isomerase/epimerase
MRLRSGGEFTRRDVLSAGIATSGTILLGGLSGAGVPPADDPYAPFKMGIHSFSLRGYRRGDKADLGKALAVTQELGLHYWESYADHIPTLLDARELDPYQRRLESAGVKVLGYGVVPLTKDPTKNRVFFQFAKLMGLTYLSANPDPSALDGVDKLIEEFDVAVGIHNHGPRDRYGRIDTIAEAIKNHHPKLGCCIDTGHFLLAGEDPVRAVQVFGKRIYGVHLKDAKDAKTFTILGRGDLRTSDLLRALAQLKYDQCLALEYEERPENPMDDLRACLKAAQESIASLKKEA